MNIEKKMIYYVNENDDTLGFKIPPMLLFDGDKTLALFLRDYLHIFTLVNDGAPQSYWEMANGDEDKAKEMFEEDIEALSAQFNYIAEHMADPDIDTQPYVEIAFAKLSKIFKYLFW